MKAASVFSAHFRGLSGVLFGTRGLRAILPILLLLAMLWAGSLAAAILPFSNYSIEEGLAQSVVLTMLQDSKGFLWFGTQDGLSRFDGMEFVNYGQAQGLTNMAILALHEDGQGDLWIGSNGGGAYRMHEGVLERFQAGSDPEGGVVHSFVVAPSGALMCVTEQGELLRFDGQGFAPVVSVEDVLTSRVYDAVMDDMGLIWLATSEDGLLRVRVHPDDRAELEISDTGARELDQDEGLPGKDLRTLYLDQEGRLWVGTGGDGLCHGNGTGAFSCLGEDQGLPGGVVRAVYQDRDMAIWAGTDKGACRIRLGDDGSIQDLETFTKDQGLPENTIYSLLQDREGRMWFGTYGGGAGRLMTERFAHYTEDNGLPRSLVYAIAEDGEGGMLFGTDGGGVSRLTKDGFEIWNTETGLAGDTVYSIMRDRSGRIWFATYGQGVSRREIDGSFTTLTEKDGLVSDKVFSVYEDSRGAVWFAADGGVSVFRDNEFVNYTSWTGLPADVVLSVFEDSTGRMWFLTLSQGVIAFTNEKSTAITTKDGLPSNRVYSVHEDEEGALWFGTSKGLCRYKDGAFTTYTTADGLSNDSCYLVAQDDRGYLWIGTNNGVNRFDGKEFRTYTVKDGLASNEFNEGAVYRDEQGRLWLGHIKGVTMLDPALDTDEPVLPRTYITAVRLGEFDVVADQDREFDHDRNYFRFEYLSPYFTAPEDLRYEYLLEGLDKDWAVSASRGVQYTSLAPGEYRFRVRAVARGEVRGEDEAVFAFSIRPPFWSMTWFRIALACSLVLLGYCGYCLKTVQIKRRNIQLEKQIAERTRDLEQEKNKADELLSNILPRDLVGELKEKGRTTPRRFDSVSILFTDFKGFTTTSSTLPPENLVSELNDMFREFDSIIDTHGLEKIKTIGDAYMIAGGLPRESKDHAYKCILAALEMQEFLKERNSRSIIKWDMRAGVHSGSVVAGVVGKIKFTYDVWGDTVNIASRMESACDPGRVNISAFTYFLVKDRVDCEYRGKVNTKGKGEIDMYYVIGLRPDPSSS